MMDALDTTHEITKLIKASPARDATVKRLEKEVASICPGIRTLCPRWTVCAQALGSIPGCWHSLPSSEIGKD